MTETLAAVFIVTGLVFFIAGSIGLLRLPDIYSRLHALTKADNVGLGLLVIGLLLLMADGLFVALKLVLVWLLVLASSATSAHLIAQRARRRERGLWKP